MERLIKLSKQWPASELETASNHSVLHHKTWCSVNNLPFLIFWQTIGPPPPLYCFFNDPPWFQWEPQWRSHWGCNGGRVPPLTVKKLPKIGKKRGKIKKNWEKRGEIGGKKGQKSGRFVHYAPPTDRAGYATGEPIVLWVKKYIAQQGLWIRG